MPLPDTADVSLLPNLGEKSARVLRSVGVHTIGELQVIGPLKAYLRAQIAGEQPSLVLLWAMVAGLRGEHWTSLSPEEKEVLKARLRDV